MSIRKRRPTMPGEILREDFLKPRGISISRFAEAVGCSRKHMSDIVNGKVRIEGAMAGRIGKVLGTSARIWLNLQAAVDGFDAEQATRRWKPRLTFPPLNEAA